MALAMSGVFCCSHSTRDLIFFYSAVACGEIWMALSSKGISIFVLGPKKKKKGCFYGVELSVALKHYILPKEQSCLP